MAWVSQARCDRIEKWLEGSPELTIEVKSPSNTKQELEDKAMTALAGGALEFWVVDGDLQTVTVYDRQRGMHIYRPDAPMPVESFFAHIDLDSLFAAL